MPGDPTGLVEQLTAHDREQRVREIARHLGDFSDAQDGGQGGVRAELAQQLRDLSEMVEGLSMKDEEGTETTSATLDGMQRALVPPCRPYRALDGTIEPRRGVETGSSSIVVGGPPATTWTRSTAANNESGRRSIWGREQYQYCPSSSDRWDTSMVNEGWLVRIHGRQRKRRFHPLHSSVPIEVSRLQGLRVTKRFLHGGGADVLQDEWTSGNRTEDNLPWKGYTFLQVKDTRNPELSDSSDVGSYERVDP